MYHDYKLGTYEALEVIAMKFYSIGASFMGRVGAPPLGVLDYGCMSSDFLGQHRVIKALEDKNITGTVVGDASHSKLIFDIGTEGEAAKLKEFANEILDTDPQTFEKIDEIFTKREQHRQKEARIQKLWG